MCYPLKQMLVLLQVRREALNMEWAQKKRLQPNAAIDGNAPVLNL